MDIYQAAKMYKTLRGAVAILAFGIIGNKVADNTSDNTIGLAAGMAAGSAAYMATDLVAFGTLHAYYNKTRGM